MIIVLSPIINDENYHLTAISPKKSQLIDLPEPVWDQLKHPYISTFFYGKAEKMTERMIRTLKVEKAINFLERKYHFQFIVHVPKGYLVYFDELYEYLLENFTETDLAKRKGRLKAINGSFIYHQKRYYSIKIFPKTKFRKKEKIRDYIKQNFQPKPHRPLNKYLANPSFSLISLGGWCGPISGIRHLQLTKFTLTTPFNYMHITMDGLLEIVDGNPDALYELEKYTLTPHRGFETKEDKELMEEYMANFFQLLKASKPILFVRTVISQDYESSFAKIIRFMDLMKSNFNRTADRMLIILHDQQIGTVKVKTLQSNIMVWAAEGLVGWHVPNRLNIIRNYSKVVEYALDDQNWEKEEPQIKAHTIINHNSKGIAKALIDIDKKEILEKIKKIKFDNQKEIPNRALYTKISIDKLLNSRSYRSKDRRNERVLRLIKKLLKEGHRVTRGTFIFDTNDECYIDYQTPIFGYAKRKSDPRNIYLIPLSTFKPNFYQNLKRIYKEGQKYPWLNRQKKLFATDHKTSPFREAISRGKDFEIYMGEAFKIPFEKHFEYQYVISMECNGPNYNLPELLISGCCVIIVEEKGQGFQIDFLTNFTPNRDYILVEYEKGATPQAIINQIKDSIENSNGYWVSNNSCNKALNAITTKRNELLFARNLNHYSKQFESTVYPNNISYYKAVMPISKQYYDLEQNFVETV